MTTTTYPTIPTLAPQTDEESPREFGLRAFRFLLIEELTAGLLSTPDLEQAMAASQLLTSAKDTAPQARERFHALRHDIASTLNRRQHEAREAAKVPPPTASQKTPPSRPVRLQRPVPMLPPSGATAGGRRF